MRVNTQDYSKHISTEEYELFGGGFDKRRIYKHGLVAYFFTHTTRRFVETVCVDEIEGEYEQYISYRKLTVKGVRSTKTPKHIYAPVKRDYDLPENIPSGCYEAYCNSPELWFADER